MHIRKLIWWAAVPWYSDSQVAVGLPRFAAGHQALTARPWSGIPLPHPTWMGRRKWFEAMTSASRAQDQELLLRALPDSRYACLDDVLMGYRLENFRLGRVLSTRRILLGAQWKLFAERGQWSNAIAALGLTGFKTAIDWLAALPGCERLFFARMGEAPPPGVTDQLKHCLRPAA